MIINNFKTIKNFIPTISYSLQNNEQTLNISHTDLIFSLTVLKKHLNFQYNLLSCISGVDLLINQYRLSVVYDFLSLTFNSRVRVKTFVNEVTPVDSIVSLYRNSNWWEREIWDLFGVFEVRVIDSPSKALNECNVLISRVPFGTSLRLFLASQISSLNLR